MAGSYDGIYRSEDRGATWNQLFYGILDASFFSLLVDGNGVYAGKNGAVLISEDLGKTWTTDLTFSPNIGVQSLVKTQSSIFAGTGGLGVFRKNEIITGTETNELANFRIFPNPVKEQLVLSGMFLTQDAVYKISSLEGKLCHTGTLRNKGSIDVSDLPSGMYLISLDDLSGHKVEVL